ncbi:hypothetical protein KKH23_03405 [Patescibacteria group bacterium]|nr:hypothetical protein [Patescibacteria group bacterium]MBU0776839.1 hypothetical protein [Patescibacteria group bacterium]MBU0846212.1 hypothetical protein [Patescibacteria group bacterium]MBU0922629.1 hypothetical protein [Patescibacteria group bacterium]MBU1066680.1 hypothetical protein [Patescibacteria group bacterium]
MAKKRTRKQKEKAKHSFAKAHQISLGKDPFEPVVKGQFKTNKKARHELPLTSKKAMDSAKDSNIVEVKKELVKSLLLASLILGIEVMIYLAWQA